MNRNIFITILLFLSCTAIADVDIDNGSHKVKWNKDFISIDGNKIYKAKNEESFKNNGCNGGESLEVLSVVENIISFRVQGESSCPGAAYSNHWDDVKVIRFDNNRAKYIGLNDIFDMKDIIKVLSKDKWIQNKYSNTEEALLSNLNPSKPKSRCGEINAWALKSFSFHHIKNGKVAVRIRIPRCLHDASSTILGVYLDTTEKMRNTLNTANKKSLLENKIKMHNKAIK